MSPLRRRTSWRSAAARSAVRLHRPCCAALVFRSPVASQQLDSGTPKGFQIKSFGFGATDTSHPFVPRVSRHKLLAFSGAKAVESLRTIQRVLASGEVPWFCGLFVSLSSPGSGPSREVVTHGVKDTTRRGDGQGGDRSAGPAIQRWASRRIAPDTGSADSPWRGRTGRWCSDSGRPDCPLLRTSSPEWPQKCPIIGQIWAVWLAKNF